MLKFFIVNKVFLFFIISIFFLNGLSAINLDDNTYISSKNITYDEENKILELNDNAYLNINDTNIFIDRGKVYYENDIVETYGNFHLSQGNNIISGQDLISNITFSDFSASNVSFVYNDDLKIDSKSINREGEVISFYNSFITPCEINGFFNCPTWSIKVPKTIYYVEEDKFIHYDSFLQVADYKVFYTPYLSHYGNKAPRKKGFLYPSIELDFLSGSPSFIIPYYLPLNESIDIQYTPSFTTSNNKIIKNFKHDIDLNLKNSRGSITLKIFNEFENETNEPYSSFRINSDQIINKNNKLSLNALYTNSISKSRSINDESIPFENIYIKHEGYNLIKKDDYISSELNTVTAYDNSNNALVPLELPSITYENNYRINSNLYLNNYISSSNLIRDESNNSLPLENKKISLKSKLSNNIYFKGFLTTNNINFKINYGSEIFENSNLNKEITNSSITLSSEIIKPINNIFKIKTKFVSNGMLKEGGLANENSNSITFNYYNLFSDNRLFGSDLIDNSTRLVYGFETSLQTKNPLSLKVGQSIDFKNNTNYLKKINQDNKISDIALEGNINFDDKINFRYDTRLNKENFSNKESNYTMNLSSLVNVLVNYNQTSRNAYKDLSNDTESLRLSFNKNINKNIALDFNTNIDLKNNSSPYYQNIGISFFDECSKFSIFYDRSKFNDNFNTKPTESIRFEFYMDYLGFVGYEQTTNLIDSKKTENYYSSGAL